MAPIEVKKAYRCALLDQFLCHYLRCTDGLVSAKHQFIMSAPAASLSMDNLLGG